jgi:uncharacterized caspase-like protein
MAGKRVALIVAVSQYSDPTLMQLMAPAQDAKGLAETLENPNIGNFEVKLLVNKPSNEIRQEIEGLFGDERSKDDLLLLYFSCHGIKDQNGHLYIATTDTNRKRLKSTSVEASFVNGLMSACSAQQQVLLLDCCYSGAFAKGFTIKADKEIHTNSHFDVEEKSRGRLVITASDSMQYSFEGDNVKKEENEVIYSVLTNALIHGLRTGEADLDGDGRITGDELYEYVSKQVKSTRPQQTPRKWGLDIEGQIVIALNPISSKVKKKPENTKEFYYKGTSYYFRKKYDEAINWFDKVLELDPKDADIWNKKGLCHYAIGKYDEAVVSFSKACEISPNFIQYKKNMELAIAQLNQTRQQKKYDKCVAIIVGINRYEDRSIEDLQGACNDANEIYQLFTRKCNFKIDKSWFLLNEHATERRVFRAFSQIFGDHLEIDLVVFYFAGHCIIDENNEVYIALYDSEKTHLYSTGISMENLGNLFSKSKTSVIIFLDCIYSFEYPRKSIASTHDQDLYVSQVQRMIGSPDLISTQTDEINNLHTQRGRLVLASCVPDEPSREGHYTHYDIDTPHAHGVFSFHLLEGLAGKAAHPDTGVITIESLRKYVENQMIAERAQKPLCLIEEASNINNIEIAKSDRFNAKVQE